jgi:hypothetical protein
VNGLVKAGLIGLVAGGLLGLGVTLLLPYCTPCAAVVVGIGVGYLASLWEKPTDRGSSAALGAKAGASAGAGHLVGQLLGMAINGLTVGPERALEMLQQFGMETTVMSPRTYWLTQIIVNTSCGLTSVIVAAGLGALGGVLWHQTRGKQQPAALA